MTKKELENIKNELKEYVANYLQVVDKNGNPPPQPETTFTSSDGAYSYGVPPYGSMSVGSGSPPRIVHSIDDPIKEPSVQSMLIDLADRTCKLNEVVDNLILKLSPLLVPTPTDSDRESLRAQSSPLVDQITSIDDRVNFQIKKLSWLIDNITI
jgi:hypothetical protein